MEEEELLRCVSTLLFVAAGFSYIRRIRRGESKSPFSMWFLFAIGCSLSFLTFIHVSGNTRWFMNFSAVGDVLTTAAISLAYVICRRVEFKIFDGVCIAIAGLVGAVWYLNQNYSSYAYLSAQAILFVAYWPTLKEFYLADKIGEPYLIWLIVLANAVLNFGLGFKDSQVLTVVYNLRAIICISLVISFMLEADFPVKRIPKGATV